MCKDYILIKGYPGTGRVHRNLILIEFNLFLSQPHYITGYEKKNIYIHTYTYIEPSYKKQSDKNHDNINYRITNDSSATR